MVTCFMWLVTLGVLSGCQTHKLVKFWSCVSWVIRHKLHNLGVYVHIHSWKLRLAIEEEVESFWNHFYICNMCFIKYFKKSNTCVCLNVVDNYFTYLSDSHVGTQKFHSKHGRTLKWTSMHDHIMNHGICTLIGHPMNIQTLIT